MQQDCFWGHANHRERPTVSDSALRESSRIITSPFLTVTVPVLSGGTTFSCRKEDFPELPHEENNNTAEIPIPAIIFLIKSKFATNLSAPTNIHFLE